MATASWQRMPQRGDMQVAVRALGAGAAQHSFERNEIIFHRGDAGSALYIVESGQVKIGLTSADGDEVTLDILGAGEMFGELSLLDGMPRSATATALAPTVILVVTRRSFLAMLAGDSEAAAHVLAMLSRRLRQTDQIVEDIVAHDVGARVANKLLDLATTHGRPSAQGGAIELHLTQQDLAALVGATRESTNRVLRAFIGRGWITIADHTIMVRQPDALRQHSMPETSPP